MSQLVVFILLFFFALFAVYYLTITILILRSLWRERNHDAWAMLFFFGIIVPEKLVIAWLLWIRLESMVSDVAAPFIYLPWLIFLVIEFIQTPISTWFFYRFFLYNNEKAH